MSVAWRRSEVLDLARVSDRVSFLHVERCQVHREDSAVQVVRESGTVNIPAGMLGCLLLGPGATLTHAGMQLLAECGVTVVWVGQYGHSAVAHSASALTSSSNMLQRQAEIVTDPESRSRVARDMYGERFPDSPVDGVSIQELRGMEGARMKQIYAAESARTGVRWVRREYDFLESPDTVNKALTHANASLYGVSHAVISALGLSPGLGVIHTGKAHSFVYDIADLYKAKVTIPLAFDVAARDPSDVFTAVRTEFRTRLHTARLLPTIVRDTARLLGMADDEAVRSLDGDVGYLWDDQVGLVRSGKDYSVTTGDGLVPR